MTDPTVITSIVGAAAAVATGAFAIFDGRARTRLERRSTETEERDSLAAEAGREEAHVTVDITNWRYLYESLRDEVERLNRLVRELRADNQAALDRQKQEHEAELRERDATIGQLRQEVEALQRVLERRPPPP